MKPGWRDDAGAGLTDLEAALKGGTTDHQALTHLRDAVNNLNLAIITLEETATLEGA